MDYVDKALKLEEDARFWSQFWYEIDLKSLNFWNEGVIRKRRYNVNINQSNFERKTEW